MKTTTSITIDPDILQRAKKKIDNISDHVQKFLENEMELKKSKTLKDKLVVAHSKIIKLSRDLEALNKENKDLKRELDKFKSRSEAQITKEQEGYIDVGPTDGDITKHIAPGEFR